MLQLARRVLAVFCRRLPAAKEDAACADNEGHAEKRQVMHLRGPTLLHLEFLSTAKRIMREAQAGPGKRREDVLTRGLFFVAEEAWKGAGAKQ